MTDWRASVTAAGSSDPDSGDAIVRFQWLVNGAPGGSQDHVDALSRKLGPSDYDLRVYDKAMAADHTTARVTVVDTTAPTLPPAKTTTFEVDDLRKKPNGHHGHPDSVTFDLATCIGSSAVQDLCVGPIDVQKNARIDHVELLALDEDGDHDSEAQKKRDLKAFEKQPFFNKEGCDDFSIAPPAQFVLPLEPPALHPGAAFRVSYSVADPSGNQAHGQCTVNLVDGDHGEHHKGPTVVGCALCIGVGCPSTCPRPAEVCSSDRDHGHH